MNKTLIIFSFATLLTLGTSEVFGQFGAVPHRPFPGGAMPAVRPVPQSPLVVSQPGVGRPTVQTTAVRRDSHADNGPVAAMPFTDPNAGVVRRIVHTDPHAGGGYHDCTHPSHGNGMGGAPYFSPQLRAQFVVVPGSGRAITYLQPNSPLRKAGIEVGDIITHMDGIPVNTNWELENHYSWTLVYGIDWRTGNRFQRRIFIP